MNKLILLLLLLAPDGFAATANLVLTGSDAATADFPGAFVTVTVNVRNLGPDAAPNVVVTLPLPPEGRLVRTDVSSADLTCEETSSAVVCRDPLMAQGDMHTITLTLESPRHTGGVMFIFDADARSDAIDPAQPTTFRTIIYFPRAMYVTSTNDSGDGTLRAALEEANTVCNGGIRCWIGFDVATPARIEPLTPLPEVLARFLTIDGRGVELRGTRVSSGDGLRTRTTHVRVRGLAITHFPGNGIWITPRRDDFAQISGCRIERNGLRGIAISSQRATVVIDTSLINHNAHSGIYAFAMTQATVSRTDIGGNGASGIFIGSGAIDLTDTTITHNRHWGVAVVPPAFVSVSSGTTIHANAGQPIDYKLDGPTPPDELEVDAVPNRPEIRDALYAPASNQTVVHVVLRGTSRIPLVRLRLYAGELERELGGHVGAPVASGGNETHWLVTIPGDLRGQRLTAIASQPRGGSPVIWASSEASEPVGVR